MVKKFLLLTVALLVSVCTVFAFQFSPLEQTFTPDGDGNMKTYTIINDSDDIIAISLSVFQRGQDEYGNEVRTNASSEFLVSPSKMYVRPQSTAIVKVQYRGNAVVPVEKAYRLIAEQIPYSQGKSESSQSMFNFLYVYATSLYVLPSDTVERVDISAIKARVDEEGNKVMDVTVFNRGNVHEILLDAELTVTDASGNKVVLTESEQLTGIDSMNILARKTVTKTIPWPEGLAFVEGGSYTGSITFTN